MSSPGGTVIGRVAVKVLPDTDDFRARAQHDLDAIEKSLKAQVQLTLDLSSESLRKASEELNHWQNKVNPVKVDAKLNLSEANMKASQARLAILARDRIINLIPRVNQAAALKAGTLLAGLSGARVIGSYFEDIAEQVGRLDKSTPKIAALALATAGLAGWGLSASANLFALSSSLAQIGPLALALPGIFGGIAIGLGATVIAFKDAKNQLPELAGEWKALQKVIQNNFWDKARKPILDLIQSLLPQFSKGVAAVSSQLGSFFGGLSSSIKGSLNGELASMFEALRKSIAIFQGATPAIANIIKVLGQVGAGLLPQLAKWVADIATQFSNFLGQAAKDGRLQQWISAAVTALSDLGRVLGNAGSLLAGLARAASAAGGSSLGMLADTLGRVADAVNTPAFQTGLTATLKAAFDAMEAISTKAGPGMMDLFTALSQMLVSTLPLVGDTIGSLVGAMASALSQPAVQTGFQALFQGIAAGVQALLPALGPMGIALGSLGQVIGTIAETLGPTLAVFFTELSKAAVQLAPVVQNLVIALGPSLAGAMRTLIPPISSLIGFLLEMLTPLAANKTLVTVLAAAILGMVAASKGAKVISKVFDFAGAVEKGVKQIGLFASGFRDANAAGSAFSGAAGTWGGRIRSIGDGFVAGIKGAANFAKTLAITAAQMAANAARVVASMAVTVASTVAGWVAMAAAAVANAVVMAAQWLIAFAPIILIGLAIAALVVLVVKNWDTIKNATVAVWNAVSGAITGAVSAVIGFVSANWPLLLAILTGPIGLAVLAIAKHWDQIKAAASAAWEGIKKLLSTAAGAILTFFMRWTLPGIILGHWTSIKNAAVSVWGSITSFISGIPGKIVGFFSRGWALVSTVTTAFYNVYKAARDKFGDVLTYVGSIPGKIVSGLGNMGSLLYNAGKDVIQGLLNGIESMIGKVTGALGKLTSLIPKHKGPPEKDAVLLYDAGQLIIDGFISGLESRYDAVKKSLQGLSSDVGATTVSSPNLSGFSGSAGVTRAVAGSVDSEHGSGKTLIYNAAPNNSLPEDDLFDAATRVRAEF